MVVIIQRANDPKRTNHVPPSRLGKPKEGKYSPLKVDIGIGVENPEKDDDELDHDSSSSLSNNNKLKI